ncbi:H-NS histone family protein [Caballeronia insecticola]|uniref:Histone family protein nucleoid-structuring protein H-NS n=1 Tax=Caballeronia insecticola TaxID=758793 RepID=R4WP36_9BURK|nr:H-NS histone family protein [Caballeronia insecticola]BAN26319.1 histone family protein nucleoid-structuring protein H-NS [Caballeronia insecticola]
MAYSSTELTKLLQQQAALNEALTAAREKEARLALIEIVQKMREYDISLNELMGRKPGEQKAEAQPKYRDPVSGATWSGRGRVPHWIAGQDRDRFLVDSESAARQPVQAALFPESR